MAILRVDGVPLVLYSVATPGPNIQDGLENGIGVHQFEVDRTVCRFLFGEKVPSSRRVREFEVDVGGPFNGATILFKGRIVESEIISLNKDRLVLTVKRTNETKIKVHDAAATSKHRERT